ncbi:MAG TPA: hypothetical protein VH333_17340 [Pseudonocardiaceae bacterium]|jgi:hypothetical protein|nr:hypothetical protein [Pseudonocardiaceae bacterium]
MSIEAIRAATADVRDQLTGAHHGVVTARAQLAVAARMLADLSRNHSSSLIPPEHLRADEQLAGCLELIAGSLACIDRFVAGL